MSELTDRRKEERDRRRNEILDAAALAASDSGFDAFTMDQVARNARLSRALVYVYFQDKAAICLALCERALELLQARFAEATRDAPNGLAQLATMGPAYVAFSIEEPVYFEALARFEARSADQLKGYEGGCLELADVCHRQMTETILAGIEDGSIRKDVGQPDAIATCLWGFMHGVIQIAATKPALLAHRNLSGEAVHQQALALLVRGLASRP